jgi:hypothetical protein
MLTKAEPGEWASYARLALHGAAAGMVQVRDPEAQWSYQELMSNLVREFQTTDHAIMVLRFFETYQRDGERVTDFLRRLETEYFNCFPLQSATGQQYEGIMKSQLLKGLNEHVKVKAVQALTEPLYVIVKDKLRQYEQLGLLHDAGSPHWTTPGDREQLPSVAEPSQ